MSADINDKFTKASNMDGNYPSVATVTAARAAGTTMLACDDLAGWATDTAVHFSTFKLNDDGTVDATSQTDWKGIVVNNTITEMTRLAGAVDSGNASGDRVELNPTIGWLDDLITGLLASHKQDGTLKDGIITTNSIINGAVEEAKIATDAVTTEKVKDGAITTDKVDEHAVTADKIDFTTMKKWVPDYANATVTNVFTSNVYTASGDGFVYVFWEGYNQSAAIDASIQVNGLRIARNVSENTSSSAARTGSVSAFCPVCAGDVVSINYNSGTVQNIREGFFIPGKWA